MYSQVVSTNRRPNSKMKIIKGLFLRIHQYSGDSTENLGTYFNGMIHKIQGLSPESGDVWSP